GTSVIARRITLGFAVAQLGEERFHSLRRRSRYFSPHSRPSNCNPPHPQSARAFVAPASRWRFFQSFHIAKMPARRRRYHASRIHSPHPIRSRKKNSRKIGKKK